MMLDNVLLPVTKSTESFLSVIKYVAFGKGTDYIYEYTFVYNNETYTTDYCFSNFYGNSYCEYNGQTYRNVVFTSKLIDTKEVDRIGLLDFPINIFVGLALLFCILKFIRNN